MKDAVGLVREQRWLRRRVAEVSAALLAIVTLMPERSAGVAPTLAAFREVLAGGSEVVALREIAERHLGGLHVIRATPLTNGCPGTSRSPGRLFSVAT